MEKKNFADLVALMTRLRGPGGCPWDRQQTLADLKPFVIEEAYEVVQAIDDGEPDSLREEVGDLLLEAVFVAEIARESGWFTIDDSITAVHDKLVQRHPHVFGDTKAESAGEVLKNWERMKSVERRKEEKGILAGVPKALPALLKAMRITEKAARTGFDWRHAEEILDKVDEEIDELREAVTSGERDAISGEIGDLLFTVVNIARRFEINAEEALQRSNRKFTRRFEAIEKMMAGANRTFDDVTLEEMDAMWSQVKKSE